MLARLRLAGVGAGGRCRLLRCIVRALLGVSLHKLGFGGTCVRLLDVLVQHAVQLLPEQVVVLIGDRVLVLRVVQNRRDERRDEVHRVRVVSVVRDPLRRRQHDALLDQPQVVHRRLHRDARRAVVAAAQARQQVDAGHDGEAVVDAHGDGAEDGIGEGLHRLRALHTAQVTHVVLLLHAVVRLARDHAQQLQQRGAAVHVGRARQLRLRRAVHREAAELVDQLAHRRLHDARARQHRHVLRVGVDHVQDEHRRVRPRARRQQRDDPLHHRLVLREHVRYVVPRRAREPAPEAAFELLPPLEAHLAALVRRRPRQQHRAQLRLLVRALVPLQRLPQQPQRQVYGQVPVPAHHLLRVDLHEPVAHHDGRQVADDALLVQRRHDRRQPSERRLTLEDLQRRVRLLLRGHLLLCRRHGERVLLLLVRQDPQVLGRVRVQEERLQDLRARLEVVVIGGPARLRQDGVRILDLALRAAGAGAVGGGVAADGAFELLEAAADAVLQAEGAVVEREERAVAGDELGRPVAVLGRVAEQCGAEAGADERWGDVLGDPTRARHFFFLLLFFGSLCCVF
eukprot:Rhum_TRINITY_DN16952_c0_g1::Rhum_TRINITY_DN16952_c0_g1_i1::g.164880::m.164880